MGLRRGKTTPYEVMRQKNREAQAAAEPVSTYDPAPVEPEPATAAAANPVEAHEPGASGEPALSRWLGGGEPMVLRVPRGVAVVVGLGLLGLVAAAYGLGHYQGADTAQASDQSDEVSGELAPRDAPAAFGETPAPSPDDAQQASQILESFDDPAQRVTTYEGGDPREAGLNYMIVARYPPDHANRLAEFLAEHGIETVQVDDGDFQQVWAVNRGFTYQEIGEENWSEQGTEAWQAYRDQLLSLGRQWREYNDGQGDRLETMYPAHYGG